ncbi:hypothetical protein C8J57DRAFT_1078216, partial [Mycena rebaudengoi]
FLTQIPQPMHRNSEMKEILSVGLTSMHSLPARNRYIPVSRCFNPLLTHFDYRTRL